MIVNMLHIAVRVRVHRTYGMRWDKRKGVGFRFWRNNRQIKSGSRRRAHLSMAMKLLETGKIYWNPDVRHDPHQVHSTASIVFCKTAHLRQIALHLIRL